MVTGAAGREGSECLVGTDFQLGKMRKFWRQKVLVGMGARQCECTEGHWTVHLKMVRANFTLCIFCHTHKKDLI